MKGKILACKTVGGKTNLVVFENGSNHIGHDHIVSHGCSGLERDDDIGLLGESSFRHAFSSGFFG